MPKTEFLDLKKGWFLQDLAALVWDNQFMLDYQQKPENKDQLVQTAIKAYEETSKTEVNKEYLA